MKKTKKENLATLCLMIAVFVNPFGFDVLQLLLIKLLGNLLRANLALYLLAAVFFGLYFFFSGKNPFKLLKRKQDEVS